MMELKYISIKTHATLDSILVVFGLATPWLFGYSRVFEAALYTLFVVLMGFGANLITKYPAGFIKVLSFKCHQFAEWLLVPPFFILFPWIFFPDAGAMPWIMNAIGIIVLIYSALTPLPSAQTSVE
jgi:hypothetical protein